MADPLIAVLSENVEPLTVSGPMLRIAPPSNPTLLEKLLSITVSVPRLQMPPPDPVKTLLRMGPQCGDFPCVIASRLIVATAPIATLRTRTASPPLIVID